MDKKILMLGLMLSGNVFGMDDLTTINDDYAMLPERKILSCNESRFISEIPGINNKAYYEIYEMVYGASIAARDTLYDTDTVNKLVEQILKSYNTHNGDFDISQPIFLAKHYANVGCDGRQKDNVLSFESILDSVLERIYFE